MRCSCNKRYNMPYCRQNKFLSKAISTTNSWVGNINLNVPFEKGILKFENGKFKIQKSTKNEVKNPSLEKAQSVEVKISIPLRAFKSFTPLCFFDAVAREPQSQALLV